MFFYGRIVIPFHSLSSKSRNSKVFRHSDFKITLSFAIIGNIAATTINNLLTMPERKKRVILSLNTNNLNSLYLVLNEIHHLQWRSLFPIIGSILVRILSKSVPKYGSTMTKSFLGTVLTTIVSVNALS